MNNKLIFLAAALLLSVAPGLNAHHGFAAHFDPENPIRIEGTVTGFDFVNPHSFLHLEVVEDTGEKQIYTCDLQARTQMTRHGYDETLFTVGEQVVVEGFPGRRNPLNCELAAAYFEDGSSFIIRTTDRARSQFAQNEELTTKTGAAEDIFGGWIRVGMYGDESGRGPNSGYDSLTEAGQKAVEMFDPIEDNPVVHCRGGSPVRNWGSAGLATEIYEEDGDIYIHHESMDIYRRVYMNIEDHPEQTEASEMGHSIGRFEDDALIIDTGYFTEGVISGSNLRSSQMKMEERLQVQEESGRLLISWTITDPLYYSDRVTGSQLLQSTTHEIQTYDCIPGMYQ